MINFNFCNNLLFISFYNDLIVAFLRCDDYGHDCDYTIKGDDDKVIDNFWEHMNDEHGIDYSKGKIWALLKKKEQKLIQVYS